MFQFHSSSEMPSECSLTCTTNHIGSPSSLHHSSSPQTLLPAPTGFAEGFLHSKYQRPRSPQRVIFLAVTLSPLL